MIGARYSISRKLMALVLVTTFFALLVSAVAMMVYEIRNYKSTWIADLTTQADILARVSGPALQFNDPVTASGNLELLKARPEVLQAAIYATDGTLFASYEAGKSVATIISPRPVALGYQIDGDHISLAHQIVEDNEVLGTVYLRAKYALAERIKSYLIILAAVMGVSLAIAALISAWLQAAITRPILAVTEVAQQVISTRNFAVRVENKTQDEIGVLVGAFNRMLGEVGAHAEALEASNRHLTREMNERREAEDALRMADQRKDEFLATLAHELRNPLAPLLSGLEIMRLTGPESTPSQRAREAMERQLAQMVRLVDDLIDVSRISTGKLTVRMQTVTLQEIVQSSAEIAAPLIKARQHHFHIDLQAEPICINADATRLSQVLSNILNNAAKYTDDGGTMSMRAFVEGETVVLEIADSGIGIAPDMLAPIFDMFTQADRSLERSQAGLGVGLTLAKRLVELHGGTIEAHSEGRGKGSRFVIRLPLMAEAKPTQSGVDAGKGIHVTQDFRILLADDNVDFIDGMGELLRAAGHQVHIAYDGAEALREAERFQPQVCFLDIGLPLLNGYELASKIRAMPFGASVKLIAVTGWGQEKDKQLAREAGFDHHLVKPVSFDKVASIMNEDPSRAVRT